MNKLINEEVMIIKDIEVDDYIENLDGSVVNVKFEKDLGDGYELYYRKDGRKFLILNFNDGNDEYIWNVVDSKEE